KLLNQCMKKLLLFPFVLYLLIGSTSAQSALDLPASLEGEIPWDFDNMKKAPPFQWEDQEDSVWSLTYQGEKFKGKVTEVFAYYASPRTLNSSAQPNGKFPAVVLVHGGGGTA